MLSTKDYKRTNQYSSWYDMMRRCYDLKRMQSFPTYKNCTVVEQWHNFQNFAKWHNENYYEVEGQTMSLDKDILIRGNKIYSPETCVFVPQNINALFTKHDAKRGLYPIGVSFHKGIGKFTARCANGNGKNVNLGVFLTPESAFNVYKKYKENLIKEIADKFKNQIPQKLYDALYKYEVCITD